MSNLIKLQAPSKSGSFHSRSVGSNSTVTSGKTDWSGVSGLRGGINIPSPGPSYDNLEDLRSLPMEQAPDYSLLMGDMGPFGEEDVGCGGPGAPTLGSRIRRRDVRQVGGSAEGFEDLHFRGTESHPLPVLSMPPHHGASGKGERSSGGYNTVKNASRSQREQHGGSSPKSPKTHAWDRGSGAEVRMDSVPEDSEASHRPCGDRPVYASGDFDDVPEEQHHGLRTL